MNSTPSTYEEFRSYYLANTKYDDGTQEFANSMYQIEAMYPVWYEQLEGELVCNIKKERVQNLVEGLCESIQECYDDGHYVSQDIVHDTAMELFLADEKLVAIIEEDEVYDFLVDNVINMVSINL